MTELPDAQYFRRGGPSGVHRPHSGAHVANDDMGFDPRHVMPDVALSWIVYKESPSVDAALAAARAASTEGWRTCWP